MANKSLTDLTARTATADSDLIHVNSGGTDYKETKVNFLQGDFNHVFANNALLTTQVNSLSVGTYIGKIASYTHQSDTGVPVNDNFYVYAHVYSAADAYVSIRRTYGDEEYVAVKSGNTWGAWTKTPTRSEITSLNNSLTNKTFVMYGYSEASQRVITVPETPINGQTYMLLVKHYLSATSFSYDLVALTFSSATSAHINWIAHNSSASITGASVSGKNITIYFGATAYCSLFVIKCF